MGEQPRSVRDKLVPLTIAVVAACGENKSSTAPSRGLAGPYPSCNPLHHVGSSLMPSVRQSHLLRRCNFVSARDQ